MPHKPSDYPSTLLWLLDETHVTVTAATALAILWTREAQCIWFGAGALSSTLVARAIKHMIRQPRPPPPAESKPAPVRPKRTYGMPSTHSTALGFYFAYLWPLLPLTTSHAWTERAVVTAITGLTLWSRVELGYHTTAQVVAGTVVGVVGAAIWRGLWVAYPAIGAQLDSAIAVVQAVISGQ